MRQELIETIVELEWEMFSRVRNTGGPASCQMDPDTFDILRSSQAGAWPDELLESWLADLRNARKAGRNLMAEKYARMMETTFPEEYRKIADSLPPVDQATRALIEDIVGVNVAWKNELAGQYPFLSGNGRPVTTREDSSFETSFETYLRGELLTYSPLSIRLLHAYTLAQKAFHINLAAIILLEQARRYGFSSLVQAEEATRH